MSSRIHVLFLLGLLFCTNVQAQVVIPASSNEPNRDVILGKGSDVVTVVETDKMVYAPGETVNVVVYYQNNGNSIVSRIPSQDTYKNPLLRLHSDPQLSGGGQYFGDIASLPVKANWGLPEKTKRPYMAYSFRLIDAKTRRALPKGYYVISPMTLAFKDGGNNTVHHAKEGAKVIFIGDNSVNCKSVYSNPGL